MLVNIQKDNMRLKLKLHIPNLLLIIVLMCWFCTSVKSFEAILNEYGTVFDVVDFAKTNLFNIQWPGQKSGDVDNYNLENYESVPVNVKTSRNEKYSCYIPNKRKSEEDAANILDPNPYSLLAKSFKDSDISPCSYRLESYWTYEVCHGRYIRQYHENKEIPDKPQLQEFMLGKFDENGFAEAEKAYEKNEGKFNPPIKKIEGNDFAYLQVNMTDGTLCDLNNKPRQAVVKYVCYPEGLNHLYLFQETVSCQYEVVILSPVLCKHSAFRMKKLTEANIICFSDESKAKKPKSLRLLEIEAAKERLSSASRLLKIAGMLDIKADDDGENAGEKTPKASAGETSKESIRVANDAKNKKVKVEVNFQLKNVPPEHPPTESKNVRPPPLPQDDENLKKDFLSGSFCLVGGTGWWKYRFCFQKRVEQFHRDEKTKRITTILLGTWNGQKIEPTQKIGELVSLYNNGDICNETGKHREVSVRLKCLKNSNNFNSVSMVLYEPKTCQYILKVESPILCLVTDEETGKSPS